MFSLPLSLLFCLCDGDKEEMNFRKKDNLKATFPSDFLLS